MTTGEFEPGEKFNWRLLIVATFTTFISLCCAGCQTTAPIVQTVSPDNQPRDKYVLTNEPAEVGRKHFARGEYALAERYLREAVEMDARDLSSWITLGASYDNLQRFDMADRAYQQALKIGGPLAATLNNIGYSYMLRGDFKRARSLFRKALDVEPGNEIVINNIRLLDDAVASTKKRSGTLLGRNVR